jgi:hypothetical protein
VGALVTVRAGGKIQTLSVVTGDSYSAQHPLSFHFGLGKTQKVDELLVEKFGRKLFQIQKPDINKYHRIKP